MPNCTVYVAGRCNEAGIPHPTGFDAYHNFAADGWTPLNSVNDVEPGDVIEFSNHSIAFVESGRGASATCSHSWYTTETGYASPGYRTKDDKTGDTAEKVWSYCLSKWEGRCWFTHSADAYGFYAAYRPPGGGGGGDPDEPPEDPPGAKGHWERVEEIIESSTPYYIDIGENECGKGVGSDQTGSQDEPKAPYQMDGNPDGSRLNERWEPLNMYTYERIMTYDQNDNPVWSSWEQKYSGSQTVMLGEQPAYGNGWEMDWGDE